MDSVEKKFIVHGNNGMIELILLVTILVTFLIMGLFTVVTMKRIEKLELDIKTMEEKAEEIFEKNLSIFEGMDYEIQELKLKDVNIKILERDKV